MLCQVSSARDNTILWSVSYYCISCYTLDSAGRKCLFWHVTGCWAQLQAGNSLKTAKLYTVLEILIERKSKVLQRTAILHALCFLNFFCWWSRQSWTFSLISAACGYFSGSVAFPGRSLEETDVEYGFCWVYFLALLYCSFVKIQPYSHGLFREQTEDGF